MRLSPFTLGLLVAIQLGVSAESASPILTAKDQAFLESLLHDFLFDPAGAQRIAVPTVDVAGNRAYEAAWSGEGWLIPAARGKPAQAFSTDGAPMYFEPGHYKRIDFRAACRARYARAPKTARGEEPNYEERDLAVAAWLYRLHEPSLAAKALAAARRAQSDPRVELRHRLVQIEYGQLIGNFEEREDEAALRCGQRLQRLYAEEAKQGDLDQLEPILKDLERRQQKGTFGKKPSKQWPDGFEQWDVARQCTYLIESLEEIHREQDGYPGGVDFAEDRRVKALIRLGDSAVPPLLDALEHDDRLTRSTHSWRLGIGAVVLGVREPVLTALMSILQVQAFEIGSSGDSLTGRGDETATATAKKLREYWNRFGAFPFDERMMKVLTDPDVSREAKREAAANLGALGQKTSRGTMFGVHSHLLQPAVEPNPAATKFEHPTAAEAILAAMDADLHAFDASEEAKEERADNARVDIASDYLWALADLGDRRIAHTVVERFTPSPSLPMRSEVAVVACRLGLEEPLKNLAEELRRGPEDDLMQWISVLHTLLPVDTEEVKAAIEAVLHPEHRLYSALQSQRASFPSDFPRTFSLKLLRVRLDDTTPTGEVARLESGKYTREYGSGGSSGPIPDYLKTSARTARTVQIRRCDEAAEALSHLSGLPFYDPMLADAPERLQRLRSIFDHFRANYLCELGPGPTFLSVFPRGFGIRDPDFPLLGRSATAEDVAAGRAIFELHGQGRLASLILPATATLKTGDRKRPTRTVTIVQAELDAHNQGVFGIIDEHEIRIAAASELRDIEPYTAILKQDAEEEADRDND